MLLLLPTVAGAQQDHPYGADSERHEGVPQGKVTHHVHQSTTVFPGTIREYWVYVPAQYDGSADAALMVFQDGHAYVSETGDFRVPIVFDNLIHQGAMPVTIGVFVNPGHHADELPKPGWGGKDNRSVEYDTLSDAYARFLLDELLPEVQQTVRISADPERRAICGISSGGICAFTAAWERPDAFRKVLSHVGSFTNIRGGHVYPALIRKQKPVKPLRVYLQDGSNDLDNEHGNWWLSNQQVAKALAFVHYDFHFEGGDGGHNGKHGGAILPDSLRWLWRPAEAEEAGAPAAKPPENGKRER
ncbi:MAG: esterase family protein [Planctomycetes bacterium]|nr:esterase family protein [Planctomycetota bacterium]